MTTLRSNGKVATHGMIQTAKRDIDHLGRERWIAFMKDDRSRWEAGHSEAGAIGKLVITRKNELWTLEEA